jgi:hypothetical protein
MALSPRMRAALMPFLSTGSKMPPTRSAKPVAPVALPAVAAKPVARIAPPAIAARAVANRPASAGRPTVAVAPKGKPGADDSVGDDLSDRAEMSGKRGAGIKAARLRERARIAAIMSHPTALADPDYAAHLALNSVLDRKSARAVLDGGPRGASAGRLIAASWDATVAPSGRVGKSPPGSIAASWDAAAALAGIGVEASGHRLPAAIGPGVDRKPPALIPASSREAPGGGLDACRVSR